MIGAPLALLIATAAVKDADGARTVFARPWLVRLGEWSFALYLSHLLVVTLIVYELPADMSGAGRLLVEVVTLPVLVAISGILHIWVEKPMNRYLRAARPLPGA